MAARIGVDVGGTFTDLVLYEEETRRVSIGKVLTTYPSPAAGVEHAVDATLTEPLLARCDLFLHGTTIGLNSLLERKGAVLGLLATRGFRDVLELRRGMRDVLYGLHWKAPVPLVPRRLRLPVTERIRADGTVETPLDVTDVRAAAELFQDHGVECIAVAFINSYANPQHEIAAEAALRKYGFRGEVSLSHRVTGEFREYERTTTTVVDAYVRPRVSHYLRELKATLQKRRFAGECLVTRSGGGAMTFTEAAARPVETVMAGPAAGAIACANLCQALGLSSAIGADVGGTSFDTCLILDGHPHIRYEGEVLGLPLQIPWIDIRSIGAGGGSIAYVEGGLLHVGPRSAGAVPGPVSYGRGGLQPTVTDAAVTLGMLGRDELASGVALDREPARASLEELGHAVALDPDETAQGVLAIISAQMADAIRSITVEVGEDPRDATLIAFGGAGPLFATLLAQELEIPDIVIPPHAGGFSAWGLLGQDVTQAAARTLLSDLDDNGLTAATLVVVELVELLRDRADSASSVADAAIEVSLDLRYAGQDYSLTVPAPLRRTEKLSNPDALRAAFEQDYARAYGHTMSSRVQIVTVRVTARTVLDRPDGTTAVALDAPHHPEYDRPAFSFVAGDWLDFAIVSRASLSSGDSLSGPCIVLEPTTTTYLDLGFSLTVHESGALLIKTGGREP